VTPSNDFPANFRHAIPIFEACELETLNAEATSLKRCAGLKSQNVIAKANFYVLTKKTCRVSVKLFMLNMKTYQTHCSSTAGMIISRGTMKWPATDFLGILVHSRIKIFSTQHPRCETL